MGTFKQVALDHGVGVTTLIGTDAILVEKANGQPGYALGSQLLDLVLGFLTEATPNTTTFGNRSGTFVPSAGSEIILNPVTLDTNYFYFADVDHTVTIVINELTQMKNGRFLVIEHSGGPANLEIMLGNTLVKIWPEHVLFCYKYFETNVGHVLRKIAITPIYEVPPEDTRFFSTSGSQLAQPSKNKWNLTGNAIDIPVVNGWEGLYFNATAEDVVLAPNEGYCVAVEFGYLVPSISLAPNKAAVVMGNGSNLLVFGDVI